MNATWTVIGVGKRRTWTLTAPSGAVLAKIYANPCCSYLVSFDGAEALLSNTSGTLEDHKRIVLAALRNQYTTLDGVFRDR